METYWVTDIQENGNNILHLRLENEKEFEIINDEGHLKIREII